jgi:hypothetical protein
MDEAQPFSRLNFDGILGLMI